MTSGQETEWAYSYRPRAHTGLNARSQDAAAIEAGRSFHTRAAVIPTE